MLRWNAQHGSLRRPSATACHPAIVSGVLFRGTSSRGSGMSSSGRLGRLSGRSCSRHGSPLADEQFAWEDLQSLTLKRYARSVAAVILVSIVVVNLVTIAAAGTAVSRLLPCHSGGAVGAGAPG